ncbi:glycosyltransferase family 1 protein [Legionella taurinensis]|uniref:Glycosyltransferase family 1 protein n=1 Tax=Legionella taurinensis TaxID=70611 RepID=A0A3A5L950_9GAMM|nr:glycosyltransferase family 1 protein [Legionella taurinensis]MDX1838555.1 glycosyltransferase family 1 protein [Legionella taurinensis]PUT39001.1 glycosyltransferase family 1 protein [Legionella taurinensis]PUT41088.1 glycosyltransferase family 1 protein [Legionella taurinensis]PUT43463.1 glycosyltransferase family 1 protein [Legionella taurinensis]PUT46480.1 glycosyltransferase family 1 protein [Legionella taurinensis]
MKRIILDITSLSNLLRKRRLPHGVPRVALAYLKHYFDDMHILFRVRGRSIILSRHHSEKVARLLLAWELGSFLKLIRLLVRGALSPSGLDPKCHYFVIKLDYKGFKYPRYLATITRNHFNMLAVLHDLIPLLNPEFCTPASTLQFKNHLSRMLEHAQGIVTISDATYHQLHRHVQKEGALCPPVVSAPLAPGLANALSPGEPLVTSPYFIILSTIGPRKNHLLLLRVFQRLLERHGRHTPKLVIIGKRSAPCPSTLALLDKKGPLKDVILEAQASDAELANYLHYARALLFPTFAEGYGLPLVEAFSFGVPVIASDLPVFRDIAGNIPDYLDPLDGLGWMQAIEDYTPEHSARRQAQLERLASFRVPAWQDHFTKVDSFMDELLAKRKQESAGKTALID